MGFPVGYSEMPSLLLNLLFLLGHLRRLSSWLTGDNILLDYPTDDPGNHHHHDATAGLDLEEHSPAVRFDALLSSSMPNDDCAVCLADFHAAARVRRPRGCSHVFHSACLDRWANHGHGTCPLCRAPLLPQPLPLTAAGVLA